VGTNDNPFGRGWPKGSNDVTVSSALHLVQLVCDRRARCGELAANVIRRSIKIFWMIAIPRQKCLGQYSDVGL